MALLLVKSISRVTRTPKFSRRSNPAGTGPNAAIFLIEQVSCLAISSSTLKYTIDPKRNTAIYRGAKGDVLDDVSRLGSTAAISMSWMVAIGFAVLLDPFFDPVVLLRASTVISSDS